MAVFLHSQSNENDVKPSCVGAYEALGCTQKRELPIV